MTYDELKEMAQGFVDEHLDEIRDKAYDYGIEELDLDGVQLDQFVDMVQSFIYPDT